MNNYFVRFQLYGSHDIIGKKVKASCMAEALTIIIDEFIPEKIHSIEELNFENAPVKPYPTLPE